MEDAAFARGDRVVGRRLVAADVRPAVGMRALRSELALDAARAAGLRAGSAVRRARHRVRCDCLWRDDRAGRGHSSLHAGTRRALAVARAADRHRAGSDRPRTRLGAAAVTLFRSCAALEVANFSADWRRSQPVASPARRARC